MKSIFDNGGDRMDNNTILVIDDDRNILAIIELYL